MTTSNGIKVKFYFRLAELKNFSNIVTLDLMVANTEICLFIIKCILSASYMPSIVLGAKK